MVSQNIIALKKRDTNFLSMYICISNPRLVSCHFSKLSGIQSSSSLLHTVLGVWPKSPGSKMVTSTFQGLEETKEQSNREKTVSAH